MTNNLIKFENKTFIIPEETEQLIDFIRQNSRQIQAKKAFLSSLDLTPEQYEQAHKNTQIHAEILLQAELKLSEKLNSLKSCRGLKKNKKGNYRSETRKKAAKTFERTIKSKTKTIREDFKLTQKKARLISELTTECVALAIAEARKQNDIVSRAWAIALKKKKHKEDNNKPYKPLGVYTDEELPIRNVMNLLNPQNYTSLFANVGIGTYYMKQNGFNCSVANELLPERCEWLQSIYPDCSVIEGNFEKEDVFNQVVKLHKEKGNVGLVCTSPCQTLTVAGKRNFKDPRTRLFLPMLQFIRETLPFWIVIENVPEYLTASPAHIKELQGKTIAQYVKDELEKLGYRVNIDVLNASDYGTCQSRERMILLASRIGLWKFPKKDKFRQMLFECIGDLPSIEGGEKSSFHPLHFAPTLTQGEIEFVKHTPSGQSAHDNPSQWKPVNKSGTKSNAKHQRSFSRRDWNKPCPTITSDSGSIGGHNTIHPGRPLSDGTYSDCRVFSYLELLRVCGLPDNYPFPTQFLNDDKLVREVIGEALMPRLLERLMTTLPTIQLLTNN